MRAESKKLIGTLGLLFFVVGQLIYFLLPGEVFALFVSHIVLGSICLVTFFFSGGFTLGELRSRSLARKRASIFTVILSTAAFLILLFVLERGEIFEYDSTQKKIYSFSEEAEAIFKELPGELTIRAFYLGGTVEDEKVRRLLRGAERRGVKVEILDPERDLSALERFGVTQAETLHFTLKMPSGELRTAKGARLSSEESFLQILKKVLRKDSPLILFSKGHGEPSIEEKLEQGFLFLKEALEGENFEVKSIALQNEERIDARLLVIAAPKEEFLERERKLVVDYLSRGGSILLLNESRTTREIYALSKLFGIIVEENIIVEPLPGGQGLGVQPRVSDFSPSSPVTRGFSRSVVLTTASSVEKGQNVDERAVKELAYSSPGSWAESNLPLLFSSTPQAARGEPGDRNGPVPVAAAFDGSVQGQRLRGRAVVIGDADFVTNLHIREVANRDFVLNAVNWLIGEEISSLSRARTLAMSTEKLSAQNRDRIFLIGAIIIPEIFAALGLFFLYRRGL